MDPEHTLERVTRSFNVLITAGEDHRGLFPSIADRETGALLTEAPAIPGQRDSDRAYRGSNLMHDHPTLRAMDALAEHTGRDTYATAVGRYLETFATDCTDTPTGLFPWGEHAFWHLEADEPGNGYTQAAAIESGGVVHDHLRLAPGWLWDRLCDSNPGCLQRFADGLDYHWLGADRREYNRHASIFDRRRGEPTGDRSCDFPAHGGYFVHDLAVAYAALPREGSRQGIVRMLEYWWEQRTEWGLLPLEAHGRTDELSLAQTLSYAVSLLDAAEVLKHCDEPGLVEMMREHAMTYLDGFLAAPHDPDDGVFLTTCRERDLRTGEFEPRAGPNVTNEITPMTVWGSVYGSGGDVIAKHALLVCSAHRHTDADRLLDWAVAAGEFQRSQPFPMDGIVPASGAETGNALVGGESVPVVAGDAGQAIGLFVDLFDLTGEQRWIDAANKITQTVLDVYFDAPLPRAATTVDHYESQTRTGYLLYNLVRLALCNRDGVDIGADYTDR